MNQQNLNTGLGHAGLGQQGVIPNVGQAGLGHQGVLPGQAGLESGLGHQGGLHGLGQQGLLHGVGQPGHQGGLQNLAHQAELHGLGHQGGLHGVGHQGVLPGVGQPGLHSGLGHQGVLPGVGQPGLGLGQAGGNILSAPQGEVVGVLGAGYPQNAGMLNQHGLGHHAGTGAGVGKKQKGMLVVRPIEARFQQDKDIIGKMDPYVKVKVGMHSAKSTVAKSEGINPVWGDIVSVKYKGQDHASIKVKDKDKLRPDSNLGKVKIPLAGIMTGPSTQWYTLEKRGNKVTGEIQLEISYQPAV